MSMISGKQQCRPAGVLLAIPKAVSYDTKLADKSIVTYNWSTTSSVLLHSSNW